MGFSGLTKWLGSSRVKKIKKSELVLLVFKLLHLKGLAWVCSFKGVPCVELGIGCGQWRRPVWPHRCWISGRPKGGVSTLGARVSHTLLHTVQKNVGAEGRSPAKIYNFSHGITTTAQYREAQDNRIEAAAAVVHDQREDKGLALVTLARIWKWSRLLRGASKGCDINYEIN